MWMWNTIRYWVGYALFNAGWRIMPSEVRVEVVRLAGIAGRKGII